MGYEGRAATSVVVAERPASAIKVPVHSRAQRSSCLLWAVRCFLWVCLGGSFFCVLGCADDSVATDQPSRESVQVISELTLAVVKRTPIPTAKSAGSFWKYEIVAAVDADKNGSGAEKRRGDNDRVGELVMGVSGSPYVYQFDRVPRSADNSPPLRGEARVEQMMAGFDGKVHWMAWFDSKDQESSRKQEGTPARATKIARKIVLCDYSADEGVVVTEAMKRLGRQESGRSLAKITNQHELLWNLQMWYSACPIHGVARRIGAVKLGRPALEAAFANSPNTHEPQGLDVRDVRTFFVYWPPRRSANGKNEKLDNLVDNWRYEVLIDEQPSAIVQCHVRFASSWLGHWPFPVPRRFNVRREGKVPDPPEATFSFTSFVGNRTELRWARFLSHAQAKKQ